MDPEAEEKFQRYCHDVGDYLRSRYRDLRKSTTPAAMDAVWGDILVHRLGLQDACEELITAQPAAASRTGADKLLWRLVFYDAVAECRRRLHLHVPLHGLSHMSSLSDSSEGIGSTSSHARSASTDGVLDEWQREWWTVALQTLLNEALGYLHGLLIRLSATLDVTSLDCALATIGGLGPQPPAFAIARRVFTYIGDVYRYQYMYLPLLAFSTVGPMDTQSMLGLARWSYARARALFVDSGRACVQLALLAAYAHNRFEAVFWQMCSLCYDDQLLRKKHGLLRVAAPGDADSEGDDAVECAVVELAQAVVARQSFEAVRTLYYDALAVLEDELAGARENCEPLELSCEFWAREYQLSVILAALLAIARHTNYDTQAYRIRVQHLAVVLLLRQLLLLRQTPADAGAAYPLSSIALWTDIWRSDSSLLLTSNNGDFGAHLAELFSDLAELCNQHGEFELAQNAPRAIARAAEALPHDVALLGWTSLRPVQKQLRYRAISSELVESADGGQQMLAAWRTSDQIRQVLAARIQLLLLSTAERQTLPFLAWGPDGRLEVALPRPLIAAPLEVEAEPLVTEAEPIETEAEPLETNGVATDLPLRIPDADAWHDHLAQLQKLQASGACVLVLADAVRQTLSAHMVQAIGEQAQLYNATGNQPEWSAANAYLFGLQAADDVSVDEDELPTADEVPEHMRGLLQCALHYAYVACPGRSVALVTDSEELTFYASWFALQCVGPYVTDNL